MPDRARWIVIAAVLLAPGFTGVVSAQTIEQALEPQVKRHAVIRLRHENALVTGRLQSLAGNTLSLETSLGSRSVPLGGVDSVWVRHRSTGTGALIGAIVGAVTGGIFIGVLAAGVCEVDCENAGVEGGLVGFALGGAGGAVLGAVIGAAIPRWKLRWP